MKLGCRHKGHKGRSDRLALVFLVPPVPYMIIVLAFQYHIYTYSVEGYSMGLLCDYDYEPSYGPSFEALMMAHLQVRVE